MEYWESKTNDGLILKPIRAIFTKIDQIPLNPVLRRRIFDIPTFQNAIIPLPVPTELRRRRLLHPRRCEIASCRRHNKSDDQHLMLIILNFNIMLSIDFSTTTQASAGIK